MDTYRAVLVFSSEKDPEHYKSIQLFSNYIREKMIANKRDLPTRLLRMMKDFDRYKKRVKASEAEAFMKIVINELSLILREAIRLSESNNKLRVSMILRLNRFIKGKSRLLSEFDQAVIRSAKANKATGVLPPMLQKRFKTLFSQMMTQLVKAAVGEEMMTSVKPNPPTVTETVAATSKFSSTKVPTVFDLVIDYLTNTTTDLEESQVIEAIEDGSIIEDIKPTRGKFTTESLLKLNGILLNSESLGKYYKDFFRLSMSALNSSPDNFELNSKGSINFRPSTYNSTKLSKEFPADIQDSFEELIKSMIPDFIESVTIPKSNIEIADEITRGEVSLEDISDKNYTVTSLLKIIDVIKLIHGSIYDYGIVKKLVEYNLDPLASSLTFINGLNYPEPEEFKNVLNTVNVEADTVEFDHLAFMGRGTSAVPKDLVNELITNYLKL